MMHRNLEGKIDGEGIKRGDATSTATAIVAPLVIGKVLIPAESPQSLKTLGGLPEVETASTITTSRTMPSTTPDKTRIPEGKPKALDSKDIEPNNIRGTMRENESAQVLAENGYKVEQLPDKIKGKIQRDKKPDFNIEGKIFDNFAPSSTKNARGIWSELRDKIADPKTGTKQADRFVINMNDSKLKVEEITKQFKDYPLEGLKEILIVKDGKAIHFFPFDK